MSTFHLLETPATTPLSPTLQCPDQPLPPPTASRILENSGASFRPPTSPKPRPATLLTSAPRLHMAHLLKPPAMRYAIYIIERYGDDPSSQSLLNLEGWLSAIEGDAGISTSHPPATGEEQEVEEVDDDED
ncbi:hypothetical protein COCNU_10G005450 [Cocos nucifera]|uniref:Uncharacterized protein n=1 Tax=Cocos nucifera TaxID=13894 RepID=A0A8K0ILZ5_COCNU|nr:hypothetical protein COCNU_10G005450 [Cocos nucifera]